MQESLTLNQIEKFGRDEYDAFVIEDNQTKPIKRNNLALFSRPPVQEKYKSQQQLSSLKNDCSRFSRLYIASQIHDVIILRE